MKKIINYFFIGVLVVSLINYFKLDFFQGIIVAIIIGSIAGIFIHVFLS